MYRRMDRLPVSVTPSPTRGGEPVEDPVGLLPSSYLSWYVRSMHVGRKRPGVTLSLPGSGRKMELWMARALEMARLAGARGEVPVGAVVVREGAAPGRGPQPHRHRRRTLRPTPR